VAQHELPPPDGDATLDRPRAETELVTGAPSTSPTAGPRPEADERRRRRGGDKRHVGFGDGFERAYCIALQHPPPEAFPVVHRNDVATLRIRLVDRRPDAILLCDGQHVGPHSWPGGEAVDPGRSGDVGEN
jgi:hypothetical protein